MSRTIRTLSELLGLLDRGRVGEALDEHMRQLIKALEDLPSEKGKARLTLDIDVAFQGGQFSILPSIKMKLPQGKAFNPTTLWASQGEFSVQHPNQVDLFPGPRAAAAE